MSSILSTKEYKEVIIDILKDFDEYVMAYKYEMIFMSLQILLIWQ